MLKINNLVIGAGILASSFVISGCNRTATDFSQVSPPAALPSTPNDPVSSNRLPPVNSNQQSLDNQPPGAPVTPDNQQRLQNEKKIANNEELPGSTIKITREALAGSWQVPTDGLDCRIILAFTKWSGGYRAATRKCVSPEIQSINAWDVKDQSVVLVDQSGNEVARLFAHQAGRYDGRTTKGDAVSFVR